MSRVYTKDKRVLAIDPSTRGFGFAVLEGSNRLIDWGVKETKNDKNRRSLKLIAELVERYESSVIVVENYTGKGSRRCRRIQGLISEISKLASKKKIKIRSFSRAKVQREILHNYGTIYQLQLKVGVSYGANLDEVLLVAKEIVAANPCVLKESASLVGISELADSSMMLSIQPWVGVADIVTARAELYKAILERFRASKIDIPFPLRDVRLLGTS